jgi:hypothetical protein
VVATRGPHQRFLGRAEPHVNDFIRRRGDVADDGVPPKSSHATVASDVAILESPTDTVASDVAGVRAMTWRATLAYFSLVWGLKVCSFSCPEQHGSV